MAEPLWRRGMTRREAVGLMGRFVLGAPLVPIAAACVGAQPGAAPTAAASAAATAAASSAAKKLAGSLSIIQWAHFVPAYDVFFDKWAKDWGTKNGVSVSVDHIPIADLPARAAAEAAQKSGHDIMGDFAQGYASLYASLNVDLTDLVDGVGKKYGGWIPAAEAVAKVNGKWLALPDFFVPFPSLWRKDQFTQAGMPDGPGSWDDLLKAAPKLKAQGHPPGTAYSQTSDGEHTWRSLLWSFGGSYFAKDGKTVAIDSAETRDALKWAKDFYQYMDPAVLSWGDADNNTCLQSGRCSWIYNPISAYRTIEDQNKDLVKDVYVNLPMKGPKAQICSIQWTQYRVWSFSKNVDAAKQFLIDYSDNWSDEFTASKGYDNPFLKDHAKKPMPVLGPDPKLTTLQDIPSMIQPFGYPGPAGVAAAEVLNTHVITDMFTEYAARGKTLDDAIGGAAKRLQAISDKYK
jgi:multiple sugar transport system substrate-binding protein